MFFFNYHFLCHFAAVQFWAGCNGTSQVSKLRRPFLMKNFCCIQIFLLSYWCFGFRIIFFQVRVFPVWHLVHEILVGLRTEGTKLCMFSKSNEFHSLLQTLLAQRLAQKYIFDAIMHISVSLQLMAVGNQTGKTFVWDIGVDDPTKARYCKQ